VDLSDGLGEGPGTEIGEVVAIDAGDDQMPEVHRARGLGHTARLGGVELRRAAVGDGAVGAVPGADIAEDHEGRGAVLPALADIRAVCLFADRVQVELPH